MNDMDLLLEMLGITWREWTLAASSVRGGGQEAFLRFLATRPAHEKGGPTIELPRRRTATDLGMEAARNLP
jgi:hypothetical protein